MNAQAPKAFYIILAVLLPLPGGAQVLPPVDTGVDRLDELRPRLEDRIGRAAERAAGEAVPDDGPSQLTGEDTALIDRARTTPADEALQATQELAETVTSTAGAAVAAAGGVVSSLQRPFVADIDPFGRPIEKNVLVVLVDRQDLPRVLSSGLRLVAQRDMAGVGMTLVTLEAENAYALADKALELRRALPDASVDYNHIYSQQQSNGAAPGAGSVEREAGTMADRQGSATRPLRVGMIDSAVQADHAALAGVTLAQEDFVTFEAARPNGHGTAVASLLAAADEQPAELFAASVFFQLPRHAPGASTESLVAALDWLASQQVDAINMSLAGPPNDLLERVIAKLAANGGPTVVAAVGNNGPAGEPQYPGAYEPVIGVTAVDRERQIFMYANRGEHVDFAALGVNVKVADAGGSWRIETGTSMASPRVAMIVAALHRHSGSRGKELREALVAAAIDLGRQGFDPVFGHGLLAQPPVIASLPGGARQTPGGGVRKTPRH